MKNSFKSFKYFIIASSPKFYHICLARKQCCSIKIMWTTHRAKHIHRSTLDQVFGLVVWLHQSTAWTNMGLSLVTSLTLSQCTLADPMSTGMPLECHWLTQCTLEYHWATQRIIAGYTGTPPEKLCWNSPHWNECHWRNSNFCSLHRNTTGGTVTTHTSPDTFSWASKVTSMPLWNDKMVGHQ